MPPTGDVLRGRRILITGPARGIGAETATQLARRGARVALVGLEPDRLAELAARLGPDAAWFEADVRDGAALEKATVGTVERFGGIDAVVANAGIVHLGSVAGIEPHRFEEVIDVNLLGVWRTIRATLPEVLAAKGYVLAVASMAAAIHLPLMAAYTAAKAGVAAMMDSLRIELDGTGVSVGVAYFSFIDTDMTHDATDDPLVRAVQQRAGRFSRDPRSLPVAAAGQALVGAIERRARSVVLPRYARPALAAPAPFQRVAEAISRGLGAPEAIRGAEPPAGER